MKKFLSLLFSIAVIIPLSAQAGNRADVLESLEQQNQAKVQNQFNDQDASITATLKSAARLFGAKDDLTTVIMIIPARSKVTVLDSDSTYYRVSFEENEGYIFKRQATIDRSAVSQKSPDQSSANDRQPIQQAQSDQRNQSDNQNQQSRFSYLENKYGSSIAARINSGKVWKGMSAEMVRDSWGNPEKINRVISGNTMKEEWIYKNTFLYIQNNTLVQWGPVRR